MSELFSYPNSMVLWTVFSAAIGAAITLGVRRQQLKDLLSDMASVEAKLVVVEDKIIAVESDMLRNYVATRTELLERAHRVLGAVARGELSVRLHGTYPLGRASDAHRDLASRATAGKLLLEP